MNYLHLLRQVPAKIVSGTKQISMYRLMALLIAYKGYSIYQYHHKKQVFTYSKMWENGIENTVLIDSGIIHEVFNPSYLVLSGIAQTLYAGWSKLPPPDYEKEIIKLPDGGQLALQSIVQVQDSKGIVIIIPGICGNGYTHYIVNTVKKSLENGYSVYVVNHRGLCDTELLTPLTYHGGSHFDAEVAINYIQTLHPDKPLYGVSYSLGSNVLTNYLGDHGHNSKLSGAVIMWCPFNSLEASYYSEKSCFGIVSRYLAHTSKAALRQHEAIFPEFKTVHGMDIEEIIKNITKFKDFDDKVTARMFGYSGAVDYYTKCWVVPRMKNIKTKTLFISALDDPFFGPEVIPYDEFEKNDNIYLMATIGGGHVGFYDTVFSTDQWHNKPTMKFFDYLNTIDRFLIKT